MPDWIKNWPGGTARRRRSRVAASRRVTDGSSLPGNTRGRSGVEAEMKLPEHVRRRRGVVAGAVVAAGLIAGFTVPALLSADAEPSRVPPTADSAPASTAPLADGRHFGTIAAAYVGPPELAFDPMEFLVGDAAKEAARADGVPENDFRDFYIRNKEKRTVSVPVAGDVAVTRVDCSDSGCAEGAPGDYDAFTISFDGETDPQGQYRGDTGWYWVTVENGFVVRIDEQYVS